MPSHTGCGRRGESAGGRDTGDTASAQTYVPAPTRDRRKPSAVSRS